MNNEDLKSFVDKPILKEKKGHHKAVRGNFKSKLNLKNISYRNF